MGGLLGNLTRMTDERLSRQTRWVTVTEARTNYRNANSWAWAEWEKRPCSIHAQADRCWRRKSDAHQV